MTPVGVTAAYIPSRSFIINEFALKSASDRGASGYHQQALLVPEARFSTILRHTNISTNKWSGWGDRQWIRGRKKNRL